LQFGDEGKFKMGQFSQWKLMVRPGQFSVQINRRNPIMLPFDPLDRRVGKQQDDERWVILTA